MPTSCQYGIRMREGEQLANLDMRATDGPGERIDADKRSIWEHAKVDDAHSESPARVL